MSILALELPDEISDWPAWLERQLVGTRLRELVQQLEMIGGVDDQTAPSLDTIIGDRHSALLGRGLIALDESQIKMLVRHPRLLLPLQELVLAQGDSYWTNVERTEEHRTLASAPWQRISAAIGQLAEQEEQPNLSPTSSPVQVELPKRDYVEPKQDASKSSRRWLVAALAVAATLLLALITWFVKSPEGQFFASRGVLDSPLKNRPFLDHMASTVTSRWQPNLDDPNKYSQQMIAFCASCDKLLASDLKQLPAGSGAELRTVCTRWRDKMRTNIADLASGKPFKDVRNEANATILKIEPALAAITIKR